MNIYLVTRTDDVSYDEVRGYVVTAFTDEFARLHGEGLVGDQPSSIWYAPTTKVTCLGPDTTGSEDGTIHIEDYKS